MPLSAIPDLHDPTQVIADIGAGGLGLPDRDYYLKPEERFQKARAQYVVHVANIFKLAGYKRADAEKAAATVMEFETALAKASLDNVAQRDPQNIDHKMTFKELRSHRAQLRMGTRSSQQLKVPTDPLNVEQPDFLEEVNRQLTETPLRRLEDLPDVAAPSRAPRLTCHRPSWTRTSTSTRRQLAGAQRDQAALEAMCRQRPTSYWAKPWDRNTSRAISRPRPKPTPARWW